MYNQSNCVYIKWTTLNYFVQFSEILKLYIEITKMADLDFYKNTF